MLAVILPKQPFFYVFSFFRKCRIVMSSNYPLKSKPQLVKNRPDRALRNFFLQDVFNLLFSIKYIICIAVNLPNTVMINQPTRFV